MNENPLETATILRWHLESNIFPPLNEHAVEGIIRCCERYQNGEIDLDTPIGDSQVTFGEMLDDLKIDLSLIS